MVTVGTSVGFGELSPIERARERERERELTRRTGSGVLKEHAWFIFHYTGTAVMSVLGVLFAGWFGYDCE